MIRETRRYQEGFTIIELMIATAVLSTMLVLVTVVMVNIGSLYYKGINQARVQDDVRSISDDVAQNIKLNDQPPVGPVPVPGVSNTYAYCIGPVRYTYVLGVQIGHQAPLTPSSGPVYAQVLWRDTNPTPGSCPTQIDPSNVLSEQVDLTDAQLATHDAPNNGSELIADNSRLTTFSMTTGSPSTVSVGVAYGDSDLLCNTGAANSCTTSTQMAQGTSASMMINGQTITSDWPHYDDFSGSVLCKGGKGDQFCSTAQLSTEAVERLAGGSF